MKHKLKTIYLRSLFLFAIIFFFFLTHNAFAANFDLLQTTTLVDFGCTEGENQTPFSDWNQVFRDTIYTKYVDPDGDPDHCGIAMTSSVPSDVYPYQGVKGTTPHNFKVGDRIIATYYNQSSSSQLFGPYHVRLSFVDQDAPNKDETDMPWHTMYLLKGFGENSYGAVAGYSYIKYQFYITNEDMLHHVNSAATEGDHTMVNINTIRKNENLVLTKIEVDSGADVTQPTPPSNVRAELFETSPGVGNTAVRLTWEHSTDNDTGVRNYLVYRNGELYASKLTSVISGQGGQPWFVDINVAPDTEYTYSISAIDNAPFGMYAIHSHKNTNKGNQSIQSTSVTITTPSWSSTSLFNPYQDLEYLGVIRLPNDGEYAYAHKGLAYYPSGNPNYDSATELPGSLYVYGHNNRLQLAELNIPKPTIVTPATISNAQTVTELQPFSNIWPAIYYYDGEFHTRPDGSVSTVASLVYHPERNEVEEGLYYTLARSYSTDTDAPVMGQFNMDLTSAQGAWHLGNVAPNHISPVYTSSIGMKAPDVWANNYLNGRSIISGSTYISGLGIPSRGPSLYASAPWESGNLPANEEYISALELLRYGSGSSYDKQVYNYRGNQFSDGGAWLHSGTKSSVAIQIVRSGGDLWYGHQDGQQNCEYDIPDRPYLGGSKGYGQSSIHSRLIFYNPNDLLSVVQGSSDPWNPQPYVEYELDPYFFKMGNLYNPADTTSAMAFDDVNEYIYIIERNGDPATNKGIIHVFNIQNDSPPRAPSNLHIVKSK